MLNFFSRKRRPVDALAKPTSPYLTPEPIMAGGVPTIDGTVADSSPTVTDQPPIRKRRSRLPRRKPVLIAGAIILALVLGVGGYLGWKFIHNASKAFGGNVFGLLSDSKLKGEDRGRVNILLAGDSEDDPGHGGSNLTDSIMIVSINTKDNTAFMLSIPRDLWVKIPNNGHQKINAANADGGMSLLENVLESKLGIPIDYYALVDYSAFRDAVNTVGGIDVTIKSPDSRGIYDPNISKADKGPLILRNGLQHLDGQTALNLARARNDPTADGRTGYGLPNGDFDRAANQRLMLTALAAKAGSVSTLSNPVKIGQLLDTLGDNVHSDFKTNDLRRLYDLSKKVGSNVQSLSLNDPAHKAVLIQNYTAPDGESALDPVAGLDDFSDIQHYLQRITSDDLVVKEGATIDVLNGSGRQGLAQSKADLLTAKNLDVEDIDNAPTSYTTTTIIDNSKGQKSATLQLLKTMFGSNITITTTNPYPKTYTDDFVIILGMDQGNSQSTTSR